jgi:hypothetical protein
MRAGMKSKWDRMRIAEGQASGSDYGYKLRAITSFMISFVPA